MNPRKGVLSTVAVIGAAFVSATASAAGSPPLPPADMQPLPVSDNPSTKVVTIGVRVTIHDLVFVNITPNGNVSLSESNVRLGTVEPQYFPNCDRVRQSCDYPLALPGYALGPHTITACYSGDVGTDVPTCLTFTVYVSELAWLPAVLSLLD